MALMTITSNTTAKSPSTKPDEAKKDPKSPSSDLKSYIGTDDVLMGRGARATENEGNVKFRQLVRNRLRDYLTAPRRQDKDQIAREILAIVKSRNGKFLRKVESVDGGGGGDSDTEGGNNTTFQAVEDDVALLKVKQALRDQKLEDSTASDLFKSEDSKKLISPGEPLGLNSKAVNMHQLFDQSPAVNPLDGTALIRRYLNEQAARASAPDVLLASRLGLPVNYPLSGASSSLLQAAQTETLLQSMLMAQNPSAMLGLATPATSPSLGAFSGLSGLLNHPLMANQGSISLDISARLQLLQARTAQDVLLKTRLGGFQQPGDAVEAARLFKRHKAN